MKIITGSKWVILALALTACGSQPPKPQQSQSSYVLPSENVLEYKQYSYADLLKRAGAKPSFNNHDYQGVVMGPSYYPKAAFKKQQQGDVLLDFTLTNTGTKEQIQIISQPDGGLFAASAIAALESWKLSPPRIEATSYTLTHVRIRLEYRILNDKPVFMIKDGNGNSEFYPSIPMILPIKN